MHTTLTRPHPRGCAIAVVGGVIASLAAAVTETVELLWIAVPAGVAGGVLVQIGVIGWDVRIGVGAEHDGMPRR